MCILLNNFLGNSQSNDENITKLRQDYEQEVKGKMNRRMVILTVKLFKTVLSCTICFPLFSEVESKYDKKLRSLREELELRRKTEIHEIEEVSLF